jgi:hypothetical protein
MDYSGMLNNFDVQINMEFRRLNSMLGEVNFTSVYRGIKESKEWNDIIEEMESKYLFYRLPKVEIHNGSTEMKVYILLIMKEGTILYSLVGSPHMTETCEFRDIVNINDKVQLLESYSYELNRRKIILINKILNFNANLVWEIDKSMFYGLICWSGGKESDWIRENVENTPFPILNDLLYKLENLKN